MILDFHQKVPTRPVLSHQRELRTKTVLIHIQTDIRIVIRRWSVAVNNIIITDYIAGLHRQLTPTHHLLVPATGGISD